MEKTINYTNHLRLRLKVREIAYDIPRQLYEGSQEKYFDTKTGYYVAIGQLRYKNKFRDIAVVYEETSSEVKIVTIHPLKPYEKLSRIKSGRWQKKI